MAHETTCPSCRRVLRVADDVHTRWLTCPRCLTAVAEHPGPPTERPDAPSDFGSVARPRIRPLAPPDVDVRRDQRGVSWIAIALGGLILVGVVLFFPLRGFAAVMATGDPDKVMFFGLLVLGAFVAGLVALALGIRSHGVTVALSVVGGLAVGAGLVLLFLLFFCMSVLATCNNSWKGNSSPAPSGDSKP